MSLLKPGWFSFRLFLFFLIPVAGYLWFSQSVLNQHLKKSVVNDPEQNLSRDLSSVKLALDQPSQEWLLKISRAAEKDALKKALTEREVKHSHLHLLGASANSSLHAPLLVMADSKSGAFFDTLGLSKTLPTPSPTPVPHHSKHHRTRHHKTPQPPLPSIEHWQGVHAALKGDSLTGVWVYQDIPYLGAITPIISYPRVVGLILAGSPLDDAFIQRLKKSCQTDLAVYVKHKITFSTLPASDDAALEKTLASSAFTSSGPSHRKPLRLGSQDYLWDEVPLLDFDKNPYGVLIVFQPSKESLTVTGDPQKTLRKWGLYLLIAVLILFFLAAADLLIGLGRIQKAVSRVTEGDLSPALPENRGDEIGRIYRNLNGMASALKERDRVSLVLGKVLSPQTAKRLLADRDHFALKGERRECALLYAELKGFNPLGENLEADQLVEVLNQYFSAAHTVVFRQEGMLDKFMGESLLAVWGAPYAHPDKEIRAVKAAVEMHQSLKELNQDRAKKALPIFEWGIGIHSGTVVTGNLGSNRRNDYTVIGPAVDLAKRLCSVTTPGQTIISAETQVKIESLVRSKKLEPLLLPNQP
ncbi:MAG: adenylate/guanylate cyclase domain-containing protein, partial [bacterium]